MFIVLQTGRKFFVSAGGDVRNQRDQRVGWRTTFLEFEKIRKAKKKTVHKVAWQMTGERLCQAHVSRLYRCGQLTKTRQLQEYVNC